MARFTIKRQDDPVFYVREDLTRLGEKALRGKQYNLCLRGPWRKFVPFFKVLYHRLQINNYYF